MIAFIPQLQKRLGAAVYAAAASTYLVIRSEFYPETPVFLSKTLKTDMLHTDNGANQALLNILVDYYYQNMIYCGAKVISWMTLEAGCISSKTRRQNSFYFSLNFYFWGWWRWTQIKKYGSKKISIDQK